MLISSGLYAQQLPFTSQYMFNDYLINPAVGGSLDYTPIALSIRSQWSGLKDAPETQFLSGHTKLGKKIGVGGYIINDQTGPVNEIGAQLSYSYHITITDKSKLSLGLGGMFFNHSIQRSKLNFDEPGDVALDNVGRNSISPDASFGILYYSKKYKIGISVPQIFQSSMYDKTSTVKPNRLVRHYFLQGEYDFTINDNFDVVPSSLVKYVVGAPTQFDLNIKGVYQKKYWIGFSYRYQESFVSLIGMSYNQFQFGYSYDYTLTDLKDFSNGTHEIYLSYILGNKKEISSAKFQ